MKMKYVILRRSSAKKFGIPSGGAAPSPPQLEVGELTPSGAADLEKKKDVDAAVPVMPLKLIEPVGVNGAAAEPGAVTWGVRAVAAHTSPFDGSGVVVAVLDTGIDPSHPAFKDVNLVRKNFTDGGDGDEHGHGTHCAGTVFGRDVDGTRIGVARGVERALIGKVLGKGAGSDRIADAIMWALEGGAHVISMSLGIDFPGYVRELEEAGIPTELATSLALEGYRKNLLMFEGLASFISTLSAFKRTTLLVAAAGNESRRGGEPEFEIAVSPPAVANGFMSVAAVEETAEGFVAAPFSNVGARVAAPGVGVYSAQRGGGLRPANGTSMATPHVAGVAALWVQKLAAGGELDGNRLYDQVVGRATTAGMKPKFVAAHVGAGVVQAPQE